MKFTTKELCLQGLLIAMVTVSTMVFQIPVSATQGYIHLGDSVIFLVSVLFGWKFGMVAGGLGSAMADMLCGYAHWAPFTLIIKGLMGFIVGKLAGDPANHSAESVGTRGFFTFRNILATTIGGIWMVFGYFLGGGILKSSFVIAATSIPENIVQGGAGIVIFFVVGAAFYRAKLYRLAS